MPDSLISFKSSQGLEVQALLLKLSRLQVVFEVPGPVSVLRSSEVLRDFQIVRGDHPVYSGEAVISNLLEAGPVLICEAALQDAWSEPETLAYAEQPRLLRAGFGSFLREWQKVYQIAADYKIIIADLQTFLTDLRLWLEHLELGVRSLPSADRIQAEREVVQQLAPVVTPAIAALFEKFEAISSRIPPDGVAAHAAYVKRQLHPLVLCAPFMYRTFRKPLGYAGDYEMVNMMLRDPLEGASIFAKVLNAYFLSTPPVVAHRNRIDYLKRVLTQEVARVVHRGRRARVFDLGCGPAKEVQDFIRDSELGGHADFTLLDFNEETLAYTGRMLNEAIGQCHRNSKVQLVRKAVAQVLKEAAKPSSSLVRDDYDLVYCAGLFDYLPDYICRQLTTIFYRMLAPGGLMVVTNVDCSNPSRNWMDLAVDWHLIYRNARAFGKLMPETVPPDQVRVLAEPSGVNTMVEARRPSHG